MFSSVSFITHIVLWDILWYILGCLSSIHVMYFFLLPRITLLFPFYCFRFRLCFVLLFIIFVFSCDVRWYISKCSLFNTIIETHVINYYILEYNFIFLDQKILLSLEVCLEPKWALVDWMTTRLRTCLERRDHAGISHESVQFYRKNVGACKSSRITNMTWLIIVWYTHIICY